MEKLFLRKVPGKVLIKLIQYLNMLPVTTICMYNVEADDVIGTLAEQARKKKLNTVI